MKHGEVTLRNLGGLHLRNAARIVQSCKKYQSRVNICHAGSCAEGCSVLQLLALGAGRDSLVRISVDGPDEERALRELSQLFSDGGGI